MAQGEKPEKFSGADFKRCQQKMLFYLTTLSLARFLKEDPPTIPVNKVDPKKRATLDAWNQSDFLCMNYILKRLENALYNVYFQVKILGNAQEEVQSRGCFPEEVHSGTVPGLQDECKNHKYYCTRFVQRDESERVFPSCCHYQENPYFVEGLQKMLKAQKKEDGIGRLDRKTKDR